MIINRIIRYGRYMLLVGGCCFISVVCGTAKRGEVFGTVAPLNAKQAKGQIAFMHTCNPCHPSGESGLGPALNNKPLPSSFIHFQVRHGLGAMPAFDKKKIPDTQLNEIIVYVRYLHSSKSGKR